MSNYNSLGRRFTGSLVLLIAAAAPWPTQSQTLPPVNSSASVQKHSNLLLEAQPVNNLLPANTTTTKAKRTKYTWFLPLFKTDVDALTFYDKGGWLSGPQQVKFLYGFGSDSKSLSADLASMTFPNGIQTTLGATVTGPANQATTSTGQDSGTQALARLQAGGDFFIRTDYPLIAAGHSDGQASFLVTSSSKMDFSVSGLGGETTITDTTNRNFNSSVEAYGQYAALKNAGYAYFDVRSGWQNVQPEFAVSTGLPHRNFLLSEFTVGLNFGNYVRVGVQRFQGPPQAFGVTKDELSKWHLVVQIMPPKK